MSAVVDRAWDALPPQEDIGESTWDPTPEAAALRALFGTSAFRLINNAHDRYLAGAQALQERIAEAYQFAREAHRAKPAGEIERLRKRVVELEGELLDRNNDVVRLEEQAVELESQIPCDADIRATEIDVAKIQEALSEGERDLILRALGFWGSDDNDAPADAIDALRVRLRAASTAA